MKGIYTALITPFDKDGNVDYASLKQIMQYQNKSNITGVVVLGSTGESHSLTTEEKQKIVKMATDIFVSKEIYVGISHASTAFAVEEVKWFENFDIDGYLVSAPYYVKPDQKGIYDYFSQIAQSTSKNICLYNIPGRTCSNIDVQTVKKLSKIENIVAIKDASGSISYTKLMLKNLPKSFAVLCGNDDLLVEMVKLGATGGVSVISNLIPNILCETLNLGNGSKSKSVVELENLLKQFVDAMSLETNPICIKYAMSKIGLCESNMRSPLVATNKRTKNQIDKIIAELFQFLLQNSYK